MPTGKALRKIEPVDVDGLDLEDPTDAAAALESTVTVLNLLIERMKERGWVDR